MDAKTAVLFAAFLPPAEFEAFDPPAAVAPAAPTYADVLARVRRGETVEFVAPLAGFPGEPGAYRCWLENGTPVMQRKGVDRPAVGTFRGLPFDADHTCDRCSSRQYEIHSFNRDGTHTHVCGRCGFSWKH